MDISEVRRRLAQRNADIDTAAELNAAAKLERERRKQASLRRCKTCGGRKRP